MLEIAFRDRFLPSVYDLGPSEVKQVEKAVNRLSTDPFYPALDLKPVQGDRTGRKYTCRASRDIRLLGFKQGGVLLLERAGHHDDIYKLARRVDVVVNEGTGSIRIVDRDQPRTPVSVPTAAPSPDGPRPFDHWGHTDLRKAGFDDNAIAAIRACRTEDDLLDLDFGDETFTLLIELLGKTPEQWRTPVIDPEAADAARFRRAIVEHGALAGISQLLGPEEITKLLAAPIEDWMIFLHPDQCALVDRRFDGPARARGASGTGKTVVALHRAAALVRRFRDEIPEGEPRTVLFTTFISSLPPVLEKLYHRLPTTRPDDDIEFINVDRLAWKVCEEAGDPVKYDSSRVDGSFASTYDSVVTDGTPLAELGVTRNYVRDEITRVIKGRGITTLEEYLGVERTGRRTPFTEAVRRQVWELMQAWDEKMAAAGVVDFPDVVLRALTHARARGRPTYRAVIVDEAQDLTLAGLQLLRALVNGRDDRDRPDGLLIVGDGAQKIYPGGFTLRQAGVEVRGRTTVLRVNYRNTREILAAAMAVAGDEQVNDLGDEYARGDADVETVGAGLKPVLVRCRDLDEQVRFVAGRIRDLVATGSIGYGDVAVAAPTNQDVKAIRRQLDNADIPTIGLDEYAGHPTDSVKLGTHFRIKGLEFKVVFLPCLGEDEFPRRHYPGRANKEYVEKRDLALSQLFVAMTRARDELFLLVSGNPSPLLGPALDRFEVVDA